MLREHGLQVAPSSYYQARQHRVSGKARRDKQLVEVMGQLRESNRFLTRFGARKMWIHFPSQGHDVARCTVERLYRSQGWQGTTRRRRFKPVHSDGTPRPADLVDRLFWAARPNRLWVADFSYVPTWSGMVYVAFVIDVFTRRIVGWRAATRMTTDLVLDALEQALWSRKQQGITTFKGLVHHTGAGNQGGFNWSSQHLVKGVCDGSSSAGCGSGCSSEVAFAWASEVPAAGRGGVLDSDCARAAARGGFGGCGRGAGGRREVVPQRWGHATVRSGFQPVGPLPAFR